MPSKILVNHEIKIITFSEDQRPRKFIVNVHFLGKKKSLQYVPQGT